MNVVSRWLVGTKRCNPSLMVEFDQHDRAVDAVIVNALVRGPTDPGEIGSVKMLRHFFHFDLDVRIVQCADIQLNHLEQPFSLR